MFHKSIPKPPFLVQIEKMNKKWFFNSIVGSCIRLLEECAELFFKMLTTLVARL
jgi:hypothetical protein